MLKFKKVKRKDLACLQKYVKNSPYKLCDYSIGVIFMWKKYFKHEYLIYNDTLILKTGGKTPRFLRPIGKDVGGAYSLIKSYTKEKKIPMIFMAVEKEEFPIFDEYKNVKSYNRDFSDYLYSFNEIKEFKGKKFSGQRNHINNFKKLYPNYKYKEISKESSQKLLKFLKLYKKQYKKMKGIEKEELSNTVKLVKNLKVANFVGGYIEVNDKIVGFSIGEYCGEVLVVHIEKALTEYKGVYPTLFNEFVKHNKRDGVVYINREDDAGDLGLRTSKLQYKPVFIANKYKVKINLI